MSNARNMARLVANESGVITTSSLPSIPGDRVTGKLTTSQLPSGSILQVRSTLYTSYNTTSINNPNWTNVPGISVNITPIRSNSNFRIDVRWGGEVASAWDVVFAISRNDTIIGLPSIEGSRMGAVAVPTQTYIDDNNDSTLEYSCFSYIDQPNTSGLITYSLVARAWDTRTLYTGCVVNIGANDIPYERISTEIIVSEIAA